MPWVGGAIAGAATIGSGIMASGSAEQAAEQQAGSEQASREMQWRQYLQTRNDQAPWRASGGNAAFGLGHSLGQLGVEDYMEQLRGDQYLTGNQIREFGEWRGLAGPDNDYYEFDDGTILSESQGRLGRLVDEYDEQRIFDDAVGMYNQRGDLNREFTVADFTKDPVEQLRSDFALREGREGINSRAAAMGAYDSGNTLKALSRYGADYGRQRAGESRDRFYQNQDRRYNRLANVAGMGQVAQQQVTQSGQNATNNISNGIIGMGNARGAASISQGNTWGQTANTIGNQLGRQNWSNPFASTFSPYDYGGGSSNGSYWTDA